MIHQNRHQTSGDHKTSSKPDADAESDILSMDVLEFVDMACNGHLSILCSIIMSYDGLFLSTTDSHLDSKQEREAISAFVEKNIQEFLKRVKQRLDQEMVSCNDGNDFRTSSSDMKFLVRSLDRFHKRLSGVKKVYPSKDFTSESMEIIKDVLKTQLKTSLDNLKSSFDQMLTSVRQTLASDNEDLMGYSGDTSKTRDVFNTTSSDLLSSLESVINDCIKSFLSDMSSFLSPDVYFMRDFGTKFSSDFIFDSREKVIVSFFKHVIDTCQEYQKTGSSYNNCPPQLILILSRLNYDLDSNIISYLINYSDEQLAIKSLKQASNRKVTATSELTTDAKSAAQNLINHYVRLEGYSLSNMIRKSIESRDWLSSVEVTSVRSVIKRLVDDLTRIDLFLGSLYEEGSKTGGNRSSESSKSRRTFSGYGGSNYGPFGYGMSSVYHKGSSSGLRTSGGGSTSFSKSQQQTPGSGLPSSSRWSSTIENSLMSDIQKLFSERIEIFSKRVEFSKLSVMTEIIKICLKTFLEIIRICTFSKNGLQQIQVDSFYLQMFCWKFVSDEKIVYNLLDEVISCSITRTLDPEPLLMDISNVEKICES